MAIDTHPDKVTLVWKGELSIKCGVMVDYEVHSQGYNVKKLINKQNRIGWYFFFSGFWLRLWWEIQEDCLHKFKKSRKIEDWIKTSQLAVWECTHYLCLVRNKQVHS